MSTSPRPQAPPDFRVNGYRLLTRLGEGGMGVVHLAQRDGERRVALKVIRPNVVGDDEARARLAREVGSLERIRSPRIAEIVDADPWGDIPYVATRYVPGLSLHDHIKQDGPIRGPDLVWCAGGLAEAVAAVHACGVLHRDIKPSNVLMEGRNPVLIDFGLARVADDPRLTLTGWLLGTPGYLAPEILLGDDATAASDVHSWAATVAFAGLGRGPFGRGPGMAIMDRVRRGEHDLEGLPPRLRSLLAECLEPDPQQRPTVPEILAEVRPEPMVEFELEPQDPPFTMPLRAVALAGAHVATDVEPVRPTLVETAITSAAGPDAEAAWGPAQEVGVATPPVGERLRRSGLGLLLACVVAGGTAAYPWLASLAVVLAVWLMRSGSLAASAVSDRRRLRGMKWYDAPQLVVSSPWHLVRSIPSTLLLVSWGGGLALAGALIGYAVSTRTETILGVAGLLFAFGLWFGPGGSRLRGPVSRVTGPVSRRPVSWLVAALLTAAAGGLLGGLAVDRGVQWTPWQHSPLHDLTWSLPFSS